MAPPKGNTYWMLANGYGKKPKRYTPEGLRKVALEYFQWNHKNPLVEEKVFGSGKRMKVKKMRAMSIREFCIFAKMSRDTFNHYEKEDAYSDICGLIKDIIYTQKFQGAAADLLNPAIIVRELGLADKKDLTSNGETLNQGYYDFIKAQRTEQ